MIKAQAPAAEEPAILPGRLADAPQVGEIRCGTFNDDLRAARALIEEKLQLDGQVTLDDLVDFAANIRARDMAALQSRLAKLQRYDACEESQDPILPSRDGDWLLRDDVLDQCCQLTVAVSR